MISNYLARNSVRKFAHRANSTSAFSGCVVNSHNEFDPLVSATIMYCHKSNILFTNLIYPIFIYLFMQYL